MQSANSLAETEVPKLGTLRAQPPAHRQKATTSLRATARIDPPDFTGITEGVDVVVPVSVTDRKGVEVVHADITTWVTPA